jgi:glycosyltransferase involved in cell wall biosynthesis
MRNFVTNPLILPGHGDDFYRRLGKRLAKQAIANLFKIAPRGQNAESEKLILKWIYGISKEDPEGLLAACRHPKVFSSLLSKAEPNTTSALPHIVAALAHYPRKGWTERQCIGEFSQWSDTRGEFSVLLDDSAEARIGANDIALCCNDYQPLCRIEAGKTHPVLEIPLLAARRHLTYHKYWRFGLKNVSLYNVSEWSSGAPDSLQTLAHPQLVTLQSAIHLLGQHLPNWVESLAGITTHIEYTPEPGNTSHLPGIMRVEAHGNPITVAERVLMAQAEDILRTCSLLIPWTSTRLRSSDLFSSPIANDELRLLAELVGLATVCPLHASLMVEGHPESTSKSFQQHRNKTLERAHAVFDQVKYHCSLSTLGHRMLAATDALIARSRSVLPSAVPVDQPTRPGRILIINLDLQDAVYSYLFQRTLTQRAYHRRHIVDVIGTHPTEAGTDIPVEMGLQQPPWVPCNGEQIEITSSDIKLVHPIIARLLKANNYIAVLGNFQLDTLNFLFNQQHQDLREVPIIAFDRHMHHQLKDYRSDNNFKAKLAEHNVTIQALLEPQTFATNRRLRAAAGFTNSQIIERLWPVSEAFFVNTSTQLRPRYPTPPIKPGLIKLFSGGNSKRDYPSLFKAIVGLPVELRIATTREFPDLPDCVTPLGRLFLHEFRNEVARADVVVLPLELPSQKKAEGVLSIGLTVVALACSLGKPVICSNSAHIREYVQDGVNGLLVKPGDVEDLRKAIKRVTGDAAFREQLATGARNSTYSLEEFCDEILTKVDSPAAHDIQLTPRVRKETPTKPAFLILHENAQNPWDLHRINDLKRHISEDHGLVCEVHDMTFADNYKGVLQAQRRINPTMIIADKMPSASGYLHACHVHGQSLPPNFIVTDYHMLGRVDLVQDEFNREAMRKSLGEWWPSKAMQIMSPYPHYAPLYSRAGIPSGAIRWLPIPAPEKDLPYGPRPSRCSTILAGGHHLRDLELFRQVLPDLPTEIRRKIHFFGQDPGIDWATLGIQYTPMAPFHNFFEALRQARFVISPLLRRDTAFGGVSLADLARAAGKPIITTDLPALREALGQHNFILIQPGDAEAFRAAILRCHADDAYVDGLAADSAVLISANSTGWLAAHLVHLARSWFQPMANT